MSISKIKREEIREKVIDLSCGLLVTAIDFSLFAVFQNCNLIREGLSGRSVSSAIDTATETSIDEVYACGIDKDAVKKAIWKATHKKLIKRKPENKNLLQITQQGWARLRSLLPVYREERPWDTHLYLITYDIPEKASGKRQILREYLKRLGCGMLQASVWVTPYNPKKVLEKLVLGHNIPGSIIVSDMGKDGNIGEEDLDDLVSRVYNLEELNRRYQDLIRELKQKHLTKTQLYFRYLSILEDDPQLPFEILPYNWLGDKAYRYLKEI